MLFRSPFHDEYIPRAVVNKATMPCSYIIEAQGKHYHGTREHLRPIHINIPSSKTHQPQPSIPKPLPFHIPKPNSHSKHTSQPKTSTSTPTLCPPSHFPRLKQSSNPTSSTNVNLSPSVPTTPRQLELPSGP